MLPGVIRICKLDGVVEVPLRIPCCHFDVIDVPLTLTCQSNTPRPMPNFRMKALRYLSGNEASNSDTMNDLQWRLRRDTGNLT